MSKTNITKVVAEKTKLYPQVVSKVVNALKDPHFHTIAQAYVEAIKEEAKKKEQIIAQTQN